jgi:hypothetical protein
LDFTSAKGRVVADEASKDIKTMTRTEQLYLRGLSLVEVVTIGEEGQVFGFASLSCDSSPTENKLLVSRAQLLGLAV